MPEIGESVMLNYAARLDDGREFESTWRTGSPLEVIIGEGQLFPKVERTICEMLPGEERTIMLSADEAYGTYDDDLIITVPGSNIPNAENMPEGRYVEIKTEQGTIRAKVLYADADNVVLDCNHELAGYDVIFDIELVSIVHKSAIERELHSDGCACGCQKLKEQIG